MEVPVVTVVLLMAGIATAVPTTDPAQQAADNMVSSTNNILASLITTGKSAEDLVAEVNHTLQYAAALLQQKTVTDEDLKLFLELARDEFAMIQKGTGVTELEDRLGKILTLLHSVSQQLTEHNIPAVGRVRRGKIKIRVRIGGCEITCTISW